MSDDMNAKIQERAYAIWEREDRPEGKHLDHWFCAQSEIEVESASDGGQSASADAAESNSGGSGREKKRSS
ncbi:DUF2934 domain-containing protein [Martelella sp. AMO21009]